MTSKNNFILMAEYNQWMNEAIYSTVSQLTPEQLAKDCGAFFGSVLGTLNHMLVGDILWLKRFANHPAMLTALDSMHTIAMPKQLDQILYSEFAQLKTQREKIDTIILLFTEQLNEQILSTPLTYLNSKGAQYTKDFSHLITHLFNHQTHHRGQVSTLLSQFGLDLGATDLLNKIPDVE